MRRLSYDWLAGLREIVMDSARCLRAFEEFICKEFMHDHDGRWIDEIPDGGVYFIAAVRNAMRDDVLRGERAGIPLDS